MCIYVITRLTNSGELVIMKFAVTVNIFNNLSLILNTLKYLIFPLSSAIIVLYSASNRKKQKNKKKSRKNLGMGARGGGYVRRGP